MDELLLRELIPAVIGVLVRRGADFASAEDAVQEALVSALATWPHDQARDPKGWLVTVAWRKFLDQARATESRRGLDTSDADSIRISARSAPDAASTSFLPGRLPRRPKSAFPHIVCVFSRTPAGRPPMLRETTHG